MAVTRKQKHIVVSPSIFGGTQKSSFIINFSRKCGSGASFVLCFQHESGVLLVIREKDTQNLVPSSPKQDFRPKNSQICPQICMFCHFQPTNGLYGQFDAMPDLKMRSRYNESDNFFWLHSLKCFQSPIKLLCISRKTTGYAQK